MPPRGHRIAWSIDRPTTAALVVALGVTLGAASLVYNSLAEYAGSTGAVTETQQMAREVDALHTMVAEAEASQRGYLLSGDEGSLGPYQQVERDLPRQMDTLRALVKDARAIALLHTLEGLVRRRMLLLGGEIELRVRAGLPAAIEVLRTGQDRAVMDSLGRVVLDIQAAEDQLLIQRLERLSVSGRTTRLALWGVGLLALMSFVAAVFRINASIGRQRAAEARLRESEERYRLVFEEAREAVVVLTEDGRYLDVNPEAERLFGRSRAEMKTLTVFDVVPPTNPDRGASEWRVIQDDGHRIGEAQLLRPDGSVVDVEYTAARIAPGQYQAIIRDIGERKEQERLRREAHQQTEESLLQTEARYQRLVESNPDGIFIQQDLRITYANPRFAQLVGAGSAAEVVGRSPLDFIEPAFHDSALQRIGSLVQVGDSVPVIERRFLHLDGSVLDAEVSAGVIEEGGRPAVQVVVRDVSERKRLEAQLQQAQKMEAIGQLAGGIAHDFNNLLTVINGYTEILTLKLPGNGPVAAALGEIGDAGRRAADLTRQLLAFSRKQVLEPKVVDPNEVVNRATGMLRRLIGEHIDLAASLRPVRRLLIDPGQLEQVIMNLAVNARDAMPDGGRLTIETADVELDASYAATHPEVTPGSYVMLGVSDTGIGMDEHTRTHAFDPFFTTKDVGQGTGLGLATVYGIVKQSGGHVWLYSEAGRGTTFKFYFPAVEDATEADRPTVEGPPQGTETILLVEDERAVRMVTRLTLEALGYQVMEAENGVEAIAVARAHSKEIDLVLTDVVMPEMNGRQMVEVLRAERPGVRVLYMSGYTDDAVVRHGVLSAEEAFLQKPFGTTGLAVKVRQVLDGRVALPETVS
jgi:two-component system, cell cycle sensor histidine kinase and response regulator CckA